SYLLFQDLKRIVIEKNPHYYMHKGHILYYSIKS
ncbi:unnamed protein product, partial [marine sediment metagenome]